MEREAWRKDEARLLEVEQDLKGLYTERDTLRTQNEKDASELEKLGLACKNAEV